MFDPENLPTRPCRIIIGGTPEGQNALVLSKLVRNVGSILHVVVDDVHAKRLSETLKFFSPELETWIFPAWDCLPYDRISPNITIMSRRIATLQRLCSGNGSEGYVVITTVNAILQKVPPRSSLSHTLWVLRKGETIPLKDIRHYLDVHGYSRTQNVHEPGDYAIRGGILDVFPPTYDHPLRLEFFADTLESLRVFDEITQRTFKHCQQIQLIPVTESFFDQNSINQFCKKYRTLQGTVSDTDPIYEAVKAGRRYNGIEHWLPLFHERLETLLDYLPNAWLTLDWNTENLCEERFTHISTLYSTRCTLQQQSAEHLLYTPLPSELLYFNSSSWNTALSHRRVAVFSPFKTPPQTPSNYDAQGQSTALSFPSLSKHTQKSLFQSVRTFIERCHEDGLKVIVTCYSEHSRDRLYTLLMEQGVFNVSRITSWKQVLSLPFKVVSLTILTLEQGFQNSEAIFITEQDIFGQRLARMVKSRRSGSRLFTEFSDWNKGDYLVHREYGIGCYDGLEVIGTAEQRHEYFCLSYEGGARLYVPVEEAEVLSRYNLEEDQTVQLDRLGTLAWQRRKAKVQKRIQDIASTLVNRAAVRSLHTATPMTPDEFYESFCARFPYPETEDQQTAITEVCKDLADERLMDRLICGDAGFGKTEVALRAAFIVAANGFQVAVMVPTTLLARQHYQTFTERFAGFPMIVAQLSSLVSKDMKNIKHNITQGTIDIIIGTHTLLSKSVQFKNLGLIIVDEEQHFGVRQKEYLKSLRSEVHVLTLTATPIPRTLQMALSGVRDMSVISTPPADRLVVRTFVLPYDPMVIRTVLLREYQRGGQSFYVCPRVEDLPKLAEQLKILVPEHKVAIAHGQMSRQLLDQVMTAFDRGHYHILLSTNIIESGLDLPNVNTLIVHRADRFGLSQLYQLRGRVGRAKQRGYAYFTYPSNKTLNQKAQRRLDVIQTLDSLCVGLQVAMHDMDIRGVGNILGEEQSGHIREVGIELFQQMLEEAVQRVRKDPTQVPQEEWIPQIHLGLKVLIPEHYIPDLHVRLNLYRRLPELTDHKMIEDFVVELIDRFGKLPEEVENLLKVIAIKQLCRRAGVKKIVLSQGGSFVLTLIQHIPNPEHFLSYLQQHPTVLRLQPDYRLIYTPSKDTPSGVQSIYRLLEDLIVEPPSPTS